MFDLKSEPQSYEEILARARHVRTKLGLTAQPKPVTIQNCTPAQPKPKVRQSPAPVTTPAKPTPVLSEKAKEALRSQDMQAFLNRHHYGTRDKSDSLSRFVDNIERWVAIQQKPRPDWVVRAIRQFCYEHGLPAVVLFSDCKIAEVIKLRHHLWSILQENDREPSYTQIGQWFSRDHTSILYGVTRHRHGAKHPMMVRKTREYQDTLITRRREVLKASIQAWDASKW